MSRGSSPPVTRLSRSSASGLSTIIQVESSSTGVSRLRGALPTSDVGKAPLECCWPGGADQQADCGIDEPSSQTHADFATIYPADSVARAISDGLAFHAFSADYITNILETRARDQSRRAVNDAPCSEPPRNRLTLHTRNKMQFFRMGIENARDAADS